MPSYKDARQQLKVLQKSSIRYKGKIREHALQIGIAINVLLVFVCLPMIKTYVISEKRKEYHEERKTHQQQGTPDRELAMRQIATDLIVAKNRKANLMPWPPTLEQIQSQTREYDTNDDPINKIQ